MSEHDEQRNLFSWAEWQSLVWPELALMFAIPNGGHRHKATAAKMKAEGVKAGVPDIFLPVMVRSKYGELGVYSGLFIEMKFGKNKPTKKQREWLEALRGQNYYATVCYSAQEAREVIADYLGREL
jgi:hypothetical protein